MGRSKREDACTIRTIPRAARSKTPLSAGRGRPQRRCVRPLRGATKFPTICASSWTRSSANAYRVTDEDIAALKQRYTEDEIFEFVIAASLGASQRRLDAGLRALEQA